MSKKEYTCPDCGFLGTQQGLIKHKCPGKICDHKCNECPIITHPNSRMVQLILNELNYKFDEEVLDIVNKHCPNLTVCPDCRIDDFVHIGDSDSPSACKISRIALQEATKKE